MKKYALAAFISIAIWICIYLPISVYGIQLLHKHRFVQVISKRHISMTFVVISFCLSHICIDRVLWVLYICKIYESVIFSMCTVVTYPIILYGLPFSLLWRFWIVRFDIHLVAASTNNKWRSVVNEESVRQNWWLLNRAKWGNRKFVALNVILPLYAFCICLNMHINYRNIVS